MNRYNSDERLEGGLRKFPFKRETAGVKSTLRSPKLRGLPEIGLYR